MPQSAHQIKEQLLKATDKDGNVKDMKTTLEIFSVLEKLPITKEDLEMTRLGLHINIIRKAAKSPEIATRAKKLIKSWQKKVNTGTSQPVRPVSSRPSTPQTNTKQIHKSKSEILLSTTKKQEIHNAKLNNISHKQKVDIPQQNGLKLKIKIPVVTQELALEKQTKKKHKKSKKSHKSPHKHADDDELAIKMRAVIKAKENLDKKNNNDHTKSIKNENITVNSASGYIINNITDHKPNGDSKPTSHIISGKSSLKRKFEETSNELNQSVTASSVIPIKKFRDKYDTNDKEYNNIASPKPKLKERGITYDPSTGKLQSASSSHVIQKSTNKDVFDAPGSTIIKPKIAEKVEENIKFYPPKLNPELVEHYPTHLVSYSHIKISNLKEASNSDNLFQECSEQKKKKVKRKQYPLSDDEETTENTSHIFRNTIQSLSKLEIQQKSNVNCSLRHEWNGVNGCQGNNGTWYNWEEEIFVKPESDTILTTPEVDQNIPLHILPYVELE